VFTARYGLDHYTDLRPILDFKVSPTEGVELNRLQFGIV
jgi:hypothetical protein